MDYTDLLIEYMKENHRYKNNPEVGCFWYDTNNNELFGVYSVLADDVPWYRSEINNSKLVKTGRKLHKDIWEKEFFRKKDKRFSGDYTKVPRGRVFQFEDGTFKVFTGHWINNYPEAMDLILDEFNLDPDITTFRKDSHWEIGHGFSEEDF